MRTEQRVYTQSPIPLHEPCQANVYTHVLTHIRSGVREQHSRHYEIASTAEGPSEKGLPESAYSVWSREPRQGSKKQGV